MYTQTHLWVQCEGSLWFPGSPERPHEWRKSWSRRRCRCWFLLWRRGSGGMRQDCWRMLHSSSSLQKTTAGHGANTNVSYLMTWNISGERWMFFWEIETLTVPLASECSDCQFGLRSSSACITNYNLTDRQMVFVHQQPCILPPVCTHTHTQEDKQHLSVKSGTISEAVLAWFLSQWFLFYSLVRLGHAATPVPEPTSGQKYDSALVSPIKAEDNWSKDGTKNSGSKMKTTFWHWATPFLSKLQNPKLVY